VIYSNKKYSIDELLTIIKTSVIVVVPRNKNLDFLYRSNSSKEEIIDFVRSLKKHQLFEGPIEDLNKKLGGYLYIFKALYKLRYWVYIK